MKIAQLACAFLLLIGIPAAASAQCSTASNCCQCCDDWFDFDDCACCWTDWEYYGGAVALSRVYPDGAILPVGLLDMQDFDNDWAAGFEVGARNDCWDVRYFQVDSFSSTYDVFGPTTYLTGAFAGLATFDYDSQLYSGEVNRYFRDRSHAVRPFVGIRYLELNEQLNFNLLGSLANSLTTGNHLYGGQLGLEALLWTSCNGRFYIDSVAKGGVYYASTGVDNTAVILANLQQSDSDDNVAFVGELQLMAGWHITRHLSLETGYQVMWIDGVALAGEQVPTINPFAPAFAQVNHGDVLFHGFKLGATLEW